MDKRIRYLWVYSAENEWVIKWHNKLLTKRQNQGYNIRNFCNTPLSLNRRWLPFGELDDRWKKGDLNLMKMYEQLAREIENTDVFILYNGANIHPNFINQFKLLKVYTAGDDPESTEILTKPVAPYFDIHLVNNIACIDTYKNWGLKNVHFWPLGSLTLLEDVADLDYEKIINQETRSNKIVFLGGYQNHRKDRFDELTTKFPQAFCAGTGWPRKFIEWEEMWKIYRHSQVGWNMHNSVGPVNFRTYELPAYGILQICDNKQNLGKIFKLNKEVIGFDSTRECIEATEYYLNNITEQREIAYAGFKRWEKEYNPDIVWDKAANIIEKYIVENSVKRQKNDPLPIIVKLIIKKKSIIFRNFWEWLKSKIKYLKQLLFH